MDVLRKIALVHPKHRRQFLKKKQRGLTCAVASLVVVQMRATAAVQPSRWLLVSRAARRRPTRGRAFCLYAQRVKRRKVQ